MTISEAQSFLGLAGYYGRFVKGFSSIACPLTKLARKDVPFSWNEKCENSFQELKDKLISALVLTHPSGSQGYVIYCDVSLHDSGCVLMQHGKVIA